MTAYKFTPGEYIWVKHPEVSGAGVVTGNGNTDKLVYIAVDDLIYFVHENRLKKLTGFQFEMCQRFGNPALPSFSVDIDRFIKESRELVWIAKPYDAEEEERDAEYAKQHAALVLRDETSKRMAQQPEAKAIRLSPAMCEVLYDFNNDDDETFHYCQQSTIEALVDRGLVVRDQVRWRPSVTEAGTAMAKTLVEASS